jgi:putative membrane protein
VADGRAVAADLVVEARVAAGEQQIPNWIGGRLNAADLNAIEAAKAKAESQTQAEIVTMIVKASTQFGHVRGVLALVLFATALFFDLHHLDVLGRIATFVLAPLLLVLCYLIAWPLSRLSIVCRALTPNYDEVRSVAHRAELEFFRGAYSKTAPCVLLFVSLTEHRAVVLADQKIADKVGPEVWDAVVGHLVEGIKTGQAGRGWVMAIEHAGQVLAQHFAASSGPKNLISNQLLFKD